jgi:hypothetical protein
MASNRSSLLPVEPQRPRTFFNWSGLTTRRVMPEPGTLRVIVESRETRQAHQHRQALVAVTRRYPGWSGAPSKITDTTMVHQ